MHFDHSPSLICAVQKRNNKTKGRLLITPISIFLQKILLKSLSMRPEGKIAKSTGLILPGIKVVCVQVHCDCQTAFSSKETSDTLFSSQTGQKVTFCEKLALKRSPSLELLLFWSYLIIFKSVKGTSCREREQISFWNRVRKL